MTTYLSLRDAPEFDAKKGDNVELDLDADTEADLLAASRIALVPRTYRVLAGRVNETDPDGTFVAAYTIPQEATLLGSHIERVETTPKPKRKEAS